MKTRKQKTSANMRSEGKFAVALASIATVFVLSLVTMFSTYVYYKQDSQFATFNIFKALGTGSQFSNLGTAIAR